MTPAPMTPLRMTPARMTEAIPSGVGSAVVWLVLLSAPWWLPLVGGYPTLGSRMLVLGLAAMALNLLLGYTGALSFGQAAYFGLGAYGAGLTMIHLAPNTFLGVLLGTLVGGATAAAFGLWHCAAAASISR